MRFVTTCLVCAVCVAASGQETESQADPSKTELDTAKKKVSYAIGVNIGRQFQRQGLELDVKILAIAISDILDGKDPALTQQEMKEAFAEFNAQQAQEKKKKAADNLAAAKKFLAENGKKKGVKTTKSGLQYMVLKEGTGATPTKENRVSTHYRGKLLSGKVFDQSYDGDAPTSDEEPVAFGVTQVIAGWTEALQLMKEGANYRLFIPPNIAYGEQGQGSIGPNSLLIFDLKLLKVE